MLLALQCIMHLEDRLQEMYLKSKMLSEYLRGHTRVHVKELGVVLGWVSSSDIVVPYDAPTPSTIIPTAPFSLCTLTLGSISGGLCYSLCYFLTADGVAHHLQLKQSFGMTKPICNTGALLGSDSVSTDYNASSGVWSQWVTPFLPFVKSPQDSSWVSVPKNAKQLPLPLLSRRKSDFLFTT